MISIIILIILSVTGKVTCMEDPTTLLVGSLLGLCAEALFIWYPIVYKNKWIGKVNYFKFIYNSLF